MKDPAQLSTEVFTLFVNIISVIVIIGVYIWKSGRANAIIHGRIDSLKEAINSLSQRQQIIDADMESLARNQNTQDKTTALMQNDMTYIKENIVKMTADMSNLLAAFQREREIHLVCPYFPGRDKPAKRKTIS